MTLKRLTDKNFPPSQGNKAIPVYMEHYNEMYDAVNILNRRDFHAMSQTYTIKHPLMAVAVYDFDVDGGATGTVNLNNNIGLLPDNAIIHNVFYDISTAVVATGATAGVIFKLPTDGNIVNIDPVLTGGNTGLGLGIPQESTAGTWIKTTAARAVQLEITGAGTINAGKIYCFIEYVVSELEPEDYPG